MVGSILSRALQDRARAVVLGVVGVTLMLAMGMGVYAELDTSFYYELPAAFLESFGISPDLGGVAGIAYGAILNFMGALALGGVAISIGAGAIAGEEGRGTLDLLLANPRSRLQVLASKTAALVLLVGASGVLLWLGAVATPVLLGVDAQGVRIGALALHLTAGSLLWGSIALAVGAGTGRRSLAIAVASGLMVVSWLAALLLPLAQATADAVRLSPWHYFSGSAPEVNGVDAGHLSVLVGLSLLVLTAGAAGFVRRDLREGAAADGLRQRLREDPRVARLLQVTAGSARVDGLAAKAVGDAQGIAALACGLLFAFGLMYPPFYNLLPESVGEVFADLPEALVAAIGGADMGTPTGWVQGEFFSLIAPIGGIALLVAIGARAIAREEENGTMDLLLSNPVSRARVLASRIAAMLLYTVPLFLAMTGGVALGVVLAGLDVSLPNVAATSVLSILLALVFGTLSLAIGAGTGRARQAIAGSSGAAVIAYVVNAFLPLAERFEPWAVLSPFHYFLSSDPLVNGMPWGHAGVLLAISALLAAVAFPLFERRDLRG